MVARPPFTRRRFRGVEHGQVDGIAVAPIERTAGSNPGPNSPQVFRVARFGEQPQRKRGREKCGALLNSAIDDSVSNA